MMVQSCTLVSEARFNHDSTVVIVPWYNYHGSAIVPLRFIYHTYACTMVVVGLPGWVFSWNSYTGEMEMSPEKYQT